jgi:hypothetical protein
VLKALESVEIVARNFNELAADSGVVVCVVDDLFCLRSKEFNDLEIVVANLVFCLGEKNASFPLKNYEKLFAGFSVRAQIVILRKPLKFNVLVHFEHISDWFSGRNLFDKVVLRSEKIVHLQ